MEMLANSEIIVGAAFDHHRSNAVPREIMRSQVPPGRHR